MKIALIQTILFWENPEQNRQYLEQKIHSITESVDLIVLPEMFTSGFTMQAKAVAEPCNGATVLWMQTIAKLKKCALTGSLIITENGKFYNRLAFVFPSGNVLFYSKRHLFRLAGEEKVYTPGTEKIIINYNGFAICPLICYDLRFPVFSRNTENYDVLLYVANWPETRIGAWDALLKARAIENMCFVVGVNRVGADPMGFLYNGHTQALDCVGNELLKPQEGEGVFILSLNKKKMQTTRQKMNFLNDADDFSIQF